MTKHESLTAPLVGLPELEPRSEMGRNERCWCGSGLKWKKCHKDREFQKRPPLSEFLAKEKEFNTKPCCLHPHSGADCGARIVGAHTVQRRGGIAAIQEDGHVLTLKRGLAFMYKTEGKFELQRIGVKGASTFNGFCDKHDMSMFFPVENRPWKDIKENAFLLSFRAAALELYAKLCAIELIKWQKQWGDAGRSFSEQASVQQYIEIYLRGLHFGKHDAEAWKSGYDDIFRTGNYNNYHYLCIEFDSCLPLAACGGMHVEYDFNGKPLQNLIRRVHSYEHLTLNITTIRDKSIAVFGWVGDPTGPSYEFLQSFLAQPEDRWSHALLRLAFENFENTYLRQSWWEGLDQSVRDVVERRALSGLPTNTRLRDRNCLAEDGIDFFHARASTAGIIL